MGQQSSQIEPTQLGSASPRSEVDSQPQLMSSIPATKRRQSHGDSSLERPIKKQKSTSPSQSRSLNPLARRPLPQSRRGTSIRPSVPSDAPAGADERTSPYVSPTHQEQLSELKVNPSGMASFGDAMEPEIGEDSEDGAARTPRTKKKKKKRRRTSTDDVEANGEQQIDEDALRKERREKKRRKKEKKRLKLEHDGSPEVTGLEPGILVRSSSKRKHKKRASEVSEALATPSIASPEAAGHRLRTVSASPSLTDRNAADDNNAVDDSSDDQQPSVLPEVQPAQKTKKKRSKKVATELHAEETQGSEILEDLEREEQRTSLSHRSATEVSDSQPRRTAPVVRTVSGPFSEYEKELMDEIFDDYCRDEGITAFELKRRIEEEWRTVDGFKQAVVNAFPLRTLISVRKFCQRRYHTHEIGPWNDELDEALRVAYIDHPGLWIKIGGLVGRSGQACRDRYRNYVMYHSGVQNGPWTAEEEEKLQSAITDALSILTAEHPEDSHDALVALIDWKSIAAKVGTRSRKKCLNKYHKMQRKAAGTTSAARRRKDGDASESAPTRSTNLESVFKKLGDGDIVDMLNEIHSALDEYAHVGAHDEEEAQWSLVEQRNPHSRFTGKRCRRVYHALLQQWWDSTDFRYSHSIAANAQWLATKVKAGRGDADLERRYKMNSARSTAESRAEKKQRKSDKRAKRLGKQQEMSEAIVYDSDE